MTGIDLRSDTVTHPSPEMRQAMYDAELGDDVLRDDPTVNKLQEQAAELLGKEAGLFVSSGTQSNLVSVLSQAQRGDEIILGDQCHILNSEAGGYAVLGGVYPHPIPTDEDGMFSTEDILGAVQPIDYHRARTVLLCIENTHNGSSGRAITPEDTKRMADAGHSRGLRVHLDGARLFNAAVALECPPDALTADVDSVGFCLSKGLSCPVGSVICGDKDFIEEARRWRKMLGGGMRQVGVLAAAGIVALDTMVDRMADDHANAKRLAFGLAEIDGIDLDPDHIQTNLVRFKIPGGQGAELSAGLGEEGVITLGASHDMRMVTHYGIDADDVDFTIAATSKVMKSIS